MKHVIVKVNCDMFFGSELCKYERHKRKSHEDIAFVASFESRVVDC